MPTPEPWRHGFVSRSLFLVFFLLPVAHCGFWLRVICKWHRLNVKSWGQEGSANWNRCFSAHRQFGGRLTGRPAVTREGRPEKCCGADCNQYFCICLHFVKSDYGKRRGAAGEGGQHAWHVTQSCPEIIHHSLLPPSLLPSSPASAEVNNTLISILSY